VVARVGAWDLPNIVEPAVAGVPAVGVDHSRLLGNTPAEVAVEKAGIIKAGSVAVLAQQEVEVSEVLRGRAAEVGATVAREGIEFGVAQRTPGVGGQLLSVTGL